MARVLKHRETRKKRNTTRHAINAERVKLHVTKGDTVRVLRGEDKGKEGKILRVLPKTGRVVIEGVNIVKKHRKARSFSSPMPPGRRRRSRTSGRRRVW